MAVSMPAVVVLIVCKTVLSGPPDQNSDYTHWESRTWAFENSKMACKRTEVALYDPTVDQGAAEQPMNSSRCLHAGAMLAVTWDVAHEKSAYRSWRFACPVPTVNTITGEIISWTLPDCGHRDTVVCESDTVI